MEEESGGIECLLHTYSTVLLFLFGSRGWEEKEQQWRQLGRTTFNLLSQVMDHFGPALKLEKSRKLGSGSRFVKHMEEKSEQGTPAFSKLPLALPWLPGTPCSSILHPPEPLLLPSPQVSEPVHLSWPSARGQGGGRALARSLWVETWIEPRGIKLASGQCR